MEKGNASCQLTWVGQSGVDINYSSALCSSYAFNCDNEIDRRSASYAPLIWLAGHDLLDEDDNNNNNNNNSNNNNNNNKNNNNGETNVNAAAPIECGRIVELSIIFKWSVEELVNEEADDRRGLTRRATRPRGFSGERLEWLFLRRRGGGRRGGQVSRANFVAEL